MKYARELLIILLVAALLRFGPLLLYGVPLSYDAPFHLARAREIVDTGFLNRAEHYPPFYRFLLAGFSTASGLPLELVGMWMLPVLSWLTVLSVFAFVRRVAGNRMGLLAALLIAVGSPLIAAAYDSPENAVFFILPACFLMYRAGHKWLPAVVLASAVLWNQLAALVVFVAFALAYWQKRGTLTRFLVSAAAMTSLYFVSVDWKLIVGQSLSGGVGFIAYNLREALPVIAFICLVFAVPLLYACRVKRAVDGWLKFWFYWFSLSTVGMASFVVGPLLRPWETTKFLYLSGAVLVGLLRGGDKFRWFVYALVAFMVFSSVILSFQLVYPKLQKPDFAALEFLQREKRLGQGAILAEPSLSQWIAYKTDLDNRLLASLHFEAAAQKPGFGEGLAFLQYQGMQGEAMLRELKVKEVVLNFEDKALRGVQALEEKPFLNKVYSVEYFTGCPFPFLPKLWSIACGWNETEVLETAW